MKWIGIYVSVLITCLLSFGGLIGSRPSPEVQIIGTWKETSWNYEKVDEKKEDDSSDFKTMTDNLKNTIKQDLIIHEAETWTFLKDGRLKLSGKNTTRTVTWRIKGRGNILQLKYDNDMVENYILTGLDNKNMFLHFETDVQARGIAKLSFKKIKD
jgi:hypothetical protein